MPQSVQTQARRLRSLPLNAERSSCFSSSLFAQAIELIDRLADRLGQITEIEIGRDLVAYIRFGEPELRLGLLEDGLRAGALGMSSGLFTPPGSFARPDEMMALCTVLKRHNAAYFTHIRDESNKI